MHHESARKFIEYLKVMSIEVFPAGIPSDVIKEALLISPPAKLKAEETRKFPLLFAAIAGSPGIETRGVKGRPTANINDITI